VEPSDEELQEVAHGLVNKWADENENRMVPRGEAIKEELIKARDAGRRFERSRQAEGASWKDRPDAEGWWFSESPVHREWLLVKSVGPLGSHQRGPWFGPIIIPPAQLIPEQPCSCWWPVTRKGRVPCPHNPTSSASADRVRWFLWSLLAVVLLGLAAWRWL